MRDVLPDGALTKPLILASASPRRAELLRQVGIDFEAQVSDVAEEADRPGTEPEQVARTHARQKALDVARTRPDRLVLGADTVVVLDGEILGKPEDEDHARRVLRRLSRRTHQVITGVAIAATQEDAPGVLVEFAVDTRVQFRELSDEEIEWYVATGEPMDKAGGYGIQGRAAAWVREIEGCYFNVVGLPLSRTWEALEELGYELPHSGTPWTGGVNGRRDRHTARN